MGINNFFGFRITTVLANRSCNPCFLLCQAIFKKPKPKSIEDSAKTYSPSERLTIEKWGGFSNESITDVEVLYEFDIQGTNIPAWFKHTAKWYVNETLDKSALIEALENLSKRGILN